MIYYTRDRDGYVLWNGCPKLILGLWNELPTANPVIEKDCDFLNSESSGLNVEEIKDVVVKNDCDETIQEAIEGLVEVVNDDYKAPCLREILKVLKSAKERAEHRRKFNQLQVANLTDSVKRLEEERVLWRAENKQLDKLVFAYESTKWPINPLLKTIADQRTLIERLVKVLDHIPSGDMSEQLKEEYKVALAAGRKAMEEK